MVGKRLHEPGIPRAEMQSTKKGGMIHLQATVDGCLHANCTSSGQDTAFFIQTDIEVGDDIITTIAQAATREEFTTPSKNRQQRRVVSWGAEKTNQKLLLFCRDGCISGVLFARVFFSVFLLCKIFPSRYERQGDFSIKDGTDWVA